MAGVAHIRRILIRAANLPVIIAALLILSVAGVQAERTFQGAPVPVAEAGVRVAASASVPRTHGPATKEIIEYETSEPVGTIIISNEERTLVRVLPGGKAERYSISVGRDGFTWTGVTRVGQKAEWPAWRPPSDMRRRQPDLPEYVPPGPYNPLGARALYLHSGGRDTLYRIHGTNDSATIGGYETSGCFRLSNRDVMDLFSRVEIGTKVIVK